MKVLHVIPTLASGGAEKILVDIVEEAQKQGVKCEVAVFSKQEAFFLKQLEDLKIKIYILGEKVYDLKHILKLRQIVKAGKYDIVHTHLFSAQLFTPLAVMLTNLKVPLVTTEHSTHNKRREKMLFKVMEFYMYSKYRKIITITEAAKKALIRHLPSTSSKTIVIENGIKLETYLQAESLKKEDIVPNYDAGEIIIVMVASLRKEKDHSTLIKSMKHLPDKYRLLLVGDGPLKNDLKTQVADLKLENRIEFLGKRKDIPNLLKACDIFVLSSNWEGFGLVAVEACAAGLPVIASNVEGLNQVVENLNGTLFEVGDEQQLAQTILSIDGGNQFYSPNLNMYSIENTVKGYIQAYKKILPDSEFLNG